MDKRQGNYLHNPNVAPNTLQRRHIGRITVTCSFVLEYHYKSVNHDVNKNEKQVR